MPRPLGRLEHEVGIPKPCWRHHRDCSRYLLAFRSSSFFKTHHLSIVLYLNRGQPFHPPPWRLPVRSFLSLKMTGHVLTVRAEQIRTTVTDLLRINHPVMLAGMNVAAGPRLAAAVTNAGGLGVIGGVVRLSGMLTCADRSNAQAGLYTRHAT